MPNLTYERSAAYSIIEALCLDLDEAGYVIDGETGDYIPTVCGMDAQRIDRVGGFVPDGSGGTRITCNRWHCIVEQVESQESHK